PVVGVGDNGGRERRFARSLGLAGAAGGRLGRGRGGLPAADLRAAEPNPIGGGDSRAGGGAGSGGRGGAAAQPVGGGGQRLRHRLRGGVGRQAEGDGGGSDGGHHRPELAVRADHLHPALRA